MNIPDTSRHAVKRIRQRLGINKSAAEREAIRAYNTGLTPKDFTGSMRKYLDHLGYRHQGTYKITPNGIFSYKGEVLATVWPVPHKFHNSVMNEWRKRYKNDDE